jgi:hypothetical protein
MPIEMDMLIFIKMLFSELPFFIPMVLFFSIVACIRSKNSRQVHRYIKATKLTGYIYAVVGIFSMMFGNALVFNIPSALGIKYLTAQFFFRYLQGHPRKYMRRERKNHKQLRCGGRGASEGVQKSVSQFNKRSALAGLLNCDTDF